MQVSQGRSLAPADGFYLPIPVSRVIEDEPVAGPEEMVQGSRSKSLAPAVGEHEPSPYVGGTDWLGYRSQTAGASDYGTEFRVSHGQVDVPTGDLSAQPMLWGSAAMVNSQSWYAYRPTLTVALRDPSLFLSRRGNPRRAGPGPESQAKADLYPPANGTPMGQRRPHVIPPGSGNQGFKGDTLTQKAARRLMGGVRRNKGPKRPKFNPLLGVRRGG